ncbi:hypothetical protein KIN20_024408 [Parelaphostrongylus tenuis]|uniref:Uncharacterized protein n=1 Tax=Parelaphostrongylus tenuis TaxID=148309 RepID=A0AAD5QW99_PARTN|nr:hypothetical protein KIN20_024408 [Parelaphostrongylus tenuis]
MVGSLVAADAMMLGTSEKCDFCHLMRNFSPSSDGVPETLGKDVWIDDFVSIFEGLGFEQYFPVTKLYVKKTGKQHIKYNDSRYLHHPVSDI